MPHTKERLQELLGGAGLRPRHKWGQNFLIDLNLMRLLVDAAGVTERDVVLEVGCGTGSLTSLLAERAGAVIAVDIDPDLFAIAQSELAEFDNVSFVNRDILHNKNRLDDEVLALLSEARERLAGEFYLIANLPYQAASPLIVNLLLDETIRPSGFYVTIQAEVGLRMAAGPGGKDYGLLSILAQATGKVGILRKLKPQAFWPMPQVHSAMVAWRRDDEKIAQVGDMKALKHTVDLLLRHRRKKIRTCLAGEVDNAAVLLEQAKIDPDARGETLGVWQFVALAQLISAR